MCGQEMTREVGMGWKIREQVVAVVVVRGGSSGKEGGEANWTVSKDSPRCILGFSCSSRCPFLVTPVKGPCRRALSLSASASPLLCINHQTAIP